MTNKNNILVDISDDLNIISSGMPLMSVEEIINQYPDLTKVSKLLRFDKEKLLSQLRNVIAQQDNTNVVADAIYTWIRKRKKTRPLVFMFAGTSGTGKTYTAKKIASSLEEDGYKYVRLDMEQYTTEADSWKLLGSSTGYSGSTDDSPIFAARKSSEKLVILFDEIEKANPILFTNIMGLMDEGLLANGKGQTYDFKQSIIVLTTNHAMDQLIQAKQKMLQMEIPITDQRFQSEAKSILKKNGIRNEICGRINWLLIYNTFNEKEVAEIALDLIRLKGQEYDFIINRVSQIYLYSIAKSCAGSNEGTRPIITIIDNEIEPIFQTACESDSYNNNEIYDIDDSLKLIKSKSDKIESFEDIFAVTSGKEDQKPTRDVLSSIIQDSIAINSTPFFKGGYNYEDYRKAMGLLKLDEGQSGYGTGFLISSNGYVLTCAHCTEANRITFVKDDDKAEYEAAVVYQNTEIDIAVLKIEVQDMPYLQITSDWKSLAIDTEIVILGYPSGTEINNNVSAFKGTISNIDCNPKRMTYQTDAVATHGSSGGAFICKEDGIVYGLLMAGYSDVSINIATDIRNLLSDKQFSIKFT